MDALCQRKAREQAPARRFPDRVVYDAICEAAGKNPAIRNTLAFSCLQDSQRTLALMGIVADTIGKHGLQGSHALDAGAGCGPLAFAFLNAGGGGVTAMELSPDLCSLMERIADRLGFRRQIEIKRKNMLLHRLNLDPGISLVMCEMVGTGLITEHLLQVVRRIRGRVRTDALYLPDAIESSVTLMSGDVAVSEPAVYDRVEMPSSDAEYVDAELVVRVFGRKPYIDVTGANIDSGLSYPNGQFTGRFEWLCDTYEGMLMEPVRLENGKSARIRIRYVYGASEVYNQGLGISVEPA